MIFTATNRNRDCRISAIFLHWKGLIALTLGLCLAIGFFTFAAAQSQTTLTLDLKGVTPSNADTWLSIPMTGRFDVSVQGETIGQVRANPTSEQIAAGEVDTLTLPDVAEVLLTPVAEDFSDGFICQGAITVAITVGEANRKTIFAYAEKGLFRVQNVSAADGTALAGGEFVVLDEQGNMQWSFTTNEQGEYLAEQALPDGVYQLVQMRAPDGSLLLDDPIAFTVDTYYGDESSIRLLTVTNNVAPVYNAVTGDLNLTATAFEKQSGITRTTLTVQGLCAGGNDTPLNDYTVTLQPAQLLDAQGVALGTAKAVTVESISVQGANVQDACVVQPLDASGNPVGGSVTCTAGDTVTLDAAAGVSIAYRSANDSTAMPAGFVAGTVIASLRYETANAQPELSSAQAIAVTAAVRYTFEYPDTDGLGNVTADSAISPKMVQLDIPDGRVTLAVTATVTQSAEGVPAVTFASVDTAGFDTDYTLVAKLPDGARFQENALPDGVQVLRMDNADEAVFSTQLFQAGTVTLPLAAGTVDSLNLWALDPCGLPETESAPEGYAIRAEVHDAMPLTDALLRMSGSSYAQLDTVLQGSAVTGLTAESLVTVVQGQLSDASGATGTPLGNLGVILQSASSGCAYGTLTDDAGAFTLLADASVQTGALTVALPENTMSSETQQIGWETLEALALPRDDLNLSFVRLSGLLGTVSNDEGTPLSGVTVALSQGGVAVQSSVTDAQGTYNVTGLQGGTYDVAVTLPDQWTAKVVLPAGTMQQARNTYTMPTLALVEGQVQTLDWTLTLLNTLRGTVMQSDAPVAGITATLTGESGAVLTAQTDAQGGYAFEELAAGTYQLTLQLPNNAVAVTANGDSVQAMGTYTATRVLTAGQAVADTFMLEATATIQGSAGPLGAGQSIAAASVDAQHSATTAADGSFLFEGLIGGAYTIYAPLPEGQTLLEGSQWSVSERGDMIWITVSIAPGDVLALPEVQFVAMTSLGGIAYMDDNGDLQRSDDELLMSGVKVALQQKNDNSWQDVADQTTNEYGQYLFENLTAGVYRVVSQAGDDLNVAAVGTSASAIGDATLGVKTSAEFTLNNGDNLTNVADVALCRSSGVEVAVFFDSNENGGRGVYERPITGVTVEAVPAADTQGQAVASAVTDANGEASLQNLTPGDYVLRFTLPDGYLFTVSSAQWGLDYSCVGGTENLTAVSPSFTLTSGQTFRAGAGAIPVGSFSGRVWSDENNDGVMNDGEPGVAGVVLTLEGTRTGNTYTLTTGDTGEYSFNLLRDDAYNFTAEIPDGMLFARYSQTGGDSRSVFTTEGTVSTRQFVITGAENVTNKNVGVITKSTLAGIAFLDENYNGIYDEGEPPYAGVTLEVIKNSNSKSMGKIVTGEDGRYEFDALRGGDYRLRAILPDDNSIFTITPTEGEGQINKFAAREGRRENSIDSIVINNGETVETCVGVAMGGTISGAVFLDAKYDGVRNGSDKKASGVKVQLVDEAGTIIASDKTNGNGNYTLEGIMPGTYTLRFQRRDGYAFTRYRPEEESGNHVQVLAKDGYGETEAISIVMGQQIEDINAGMLPSSTLTGVFFEDLNDNGLQDEGETGFVSGHVRLLSEDGEIDLTEPVEQDGTYFFDGVMPGEYSVTYLLPDNATMASVVEGGNTLEAQGAENVLSGLDVESGKAYEAPLVGAVTLGSFEGFAFHDSNANGVMDDGEQAMPGVTVTLNGSTSADAEATSVSDDEGMFAIYELRPDQYTLTLELPEGYIFSHNLTQSSIVLDTAQTVTTACPWTALINRVQNPIGAVQPATIQAAVWLDENRDGVEKQGERGLSELSMELYDEAEAQVVKSARTGEDGVAMFDSVRPGTYTVRFTLPTQSQPAGDSETTFTLQGSKMVQGGITVAEGETFDSIRGGLVSYTSIGGKITLDENGTRTEQAGITVSLYQAGNATALKTVQTDETGVYQFDGLWPGEYSLTVERPSDMIFVQPDDPNYEQGASVITQTQDNLGMSDSLQLEMAQHQLSCDVIFIKPARVGDEVWLDSNGNGLLDAGEPSINGVTVQLLSEGEVAYTTISNEWGYYEFSDVYPGTYTLQAQAYPELDITQSIPALKIISSCLTSGDGTNAQSDPFTVESGSRNFDNDLGYILRAGESMPSQVTPGAVQKWLTTTESENQ